MPPYRLSVHPLQIPLKTTFKQASHTRTYSESVYVSAKGEGIIGIGEGCPRPYVTGESLSEATAWIQAILSKIEQSVHSFPALTEFIAENEPEIDQHPAAWCAIETALLDFFARMEKRSVEALLGWMKR